MAPFFFKQKKASTFSCSTPNISSVCTSIDRKSISSPSSGRTIDRQTPRLSQLWRVTSLRHWSSQPTTNNNKKKKKKQEKQPEMISPGNSSRFLLNDTPFFDAPSEPKPVLALPSMDLKREEVGVLRSSSSARAPDQQVVALRVSLHCKGCEGKVRKHISKMEGVTSFVTDLATKKVVVIGDVTPLGVLNSVSKVKSAEFWSSPPRTAESRI